MKSFSNKTIPLIFTSLAIGASPFSFLTTSCSQSNAIQLANFESYMDNVLMDHLRKDYGIQFQWYTVTEMIETKFEKVYDVAIPSGYEVVALYRKNLLEKIDWLKFNIPGVIDAQTAKQKLYAADVIKSINQMNDSFRKYDGIPSDFDVLDYGVPYFTQSFSFMYKGSEMKFYKDGTTTETTEPNWCDIFYSISPNNPNLDSRFNPSKPTGRLGMLDDAKTLYDISRIMETTKKHPLEPDQVTNDMPANAQIPDLLNTFNHLTDNFKNKKTSSWFALNTDSGIISRNLADHDKGYAAALTWSGDALYSALGAGEFDAYTGSQMHIQKTVNHSLDEMEFIVVNKKNHDNLGKLNKIYNAIYDIALDAYNATEDNIFDKINDGANKRYKYWSVQNWDKVNYTPTLASLYNYVIKPECPYWDQYVAKTDLSSRSLYTSILKIASNTTRSIFGKPLTSLQNSNIHWAWLQSRGKL